MTKMTEINRNDRNDKSSQKFPKSNNNNYLLTSRTAERHARGQKLHTSMNSRIWFHIQNCLQEIFKSWTCQLAPWREILLPTRFLFVALVTNVVHRWRQVKLFSLSLQNGHLSTHFWVMPTKVWAEHLRIWCGTSLITPIFVPVSQWLSDLTAPRNPALTWYEYRIWSNSLLSPFVGHRLNCGT